MESSLAVLRRAIRDEIAGQRFYYDASFHCLDPWAKEIFANLAREEETHTQLLLGEYLSLTREGRWIDPNLVLASELEVDITEISFAADETAEELFPPQWTAGDAVDRRADDVDALEFGIRMERRALTLYSDEAMRAADPAAHEAYRFLVEEETRHYQQLRDQWEKLAGMRYVEVSAGTEEIWRKGVARESLE